MFSIHFVADDSNRIYSCVTDKEYPARIAFAMLEEMQTKFLTKVNDTVAAKAHERSPRHKRQLGSQTSCCILGEVARRVEAGRY